MTVWTRKRHNRNSKTILERLFRRECANKFLPFFFPLFLHSSRQPSRPSASLPRPPAHFVSAAAATPFRFFYDINLETKRQPRHSAWPGLGWAGLGWAGRGRSRVGIVRRVWNLYVYVRVRVSLCKTFEGCLDGLVHANWNWRKVRADSKRRILITTRCHETWRDGLWDGPEAERNRQHSQLLWNKNTNNRIAGRTLFFNAIFVFTLGTFGIGGLPKCACCELDIRTYASTFPLPFPIWWWSVECPKGEVMTRFGSTTPVGGEGELTASIKFYVRAYVEKRTDDGSRMLK